jgi:hypothetical protein
MCGRAGRDRGLARRLLSFVSSCVDATIKHSVNHVIGVAMSNRQQTFALLKLGTQCSRLIHLVLNLQRDQSITILDFPHLSKLHPGINFGLDIGKRRNIIIIKQVTVFHRVGCLQLCNFDLLQKSSPPAKGRLGECCSSVTLFFHSTGTLLSYLLLCIHSFFFGTFCVANLELFRFVYSTLFVFYDESPEEESMQSGKTPILRHFVGVGNICLVIKTPLVLFPCTGWCLFFFQKRRHHQLRLHHQHSHFL